MSRLGAEKDEKISKNKLSSATLNQRDRVARFKQKISIKNSLKNTSIILKK